MTQPVIETAAAKPPRLMSLDVFRGLDIALMILVNMTWDRQAHWGQLHHIGWNNGNQGATLTDLVFPWFLFIVGVAIPFSMGSGRGRTQTPTQRIVGAFRRALVLYTLGLILDAASAGTFLFLKWNILQLIGAAYFVAICVAHLPTYLQAVFCVLVLGAKWYILSIYAHPEFGENVWFFAVNGEPVDNRYAAGAVPYNGEQVFKSRMLDLFEVGSTLRIWANWATNIFNLLPAAVVVVLGGFAGKALRANTDRSPRVPLTLIGIGLAGWLASWLWNLHHPWSKDFFTASYALLAASTGTALLGLCYLLIDAELGIAFPKPIASAGRAAVFASRVLGLNAIALYFGNEFVFKAIVTKWKLGWTGDTAMIHSWRHLLVDLFGIVPGELLFATSWLTLWWLICFWMYRKKIFVKV